VTAHVRSHIYCYAIVCLYTRLMRNWGMALGPLLCWCFVWMGWTCELYCLRDNSIKRLARQTLF